MKTNHELKTILVGNTGFVGSNLAEQANFNGLFHSNNIAEAFGSRADLCVYAGVRAEKFLANKEPDRDKKMIQAAIENIKAIAPKKLVLISTIDVYPCAVNVDEATDIEPNGLQPYGFNRYALETWVRENCESYHVIRLPALFGKNIKKNFIYDLITFIPALLTEKKFEELHSKNKLLSGYYDRLENGFYKCKALTAREAELVKSYLKELNFSALHFTDSRASFPFYNLEYLWRHIELAIKNDIKLVNMAVEPLSVAKLYQEIIGEEFCNEIAEFPPHYNFKTQYASLFGGKDGYIFNERTVLSDLKKFVEERTK